MKRLSRAENRNSAESVLTAARGEAVKIDRQLREVETKLSEKRASFGESLLAGIDVGTLRKTLATLEHSRAELRERSAENRELCESLAAALERDIREEAMSNLTDRYAVFLSEKEKSVDVLDAIDKRIDALEKIRIEAVAYWNQAQPADHGDMVAWNQRMIGMDGRIRQLRFRRNDLETLLQY